MSCACLEWRADVANCCHIQAMSLSVGLFRRKEPVSPSWLRTVSCYVQKYIYTRFPSETVTRSGYQVCQYLPNATATCMLRLCMKQAWPQHLPS